MKSKCSRVQRDSEREGNEGERGEKIICERLETAAVGSKMWR